MGFVYGAIAVLFLIYLFLRIAGMLGVNKTVISVQQPSSDSREEEFDPQRFNTAPLPMRTAEEIREVEDSMPVEWVVYDGATPPLRLKLKGQSYESYRRVTRKHIDEIGQDNVERLSPDQLDALNRTIISDAYVLDWEGALYPNGNPMPYSPANLSVRLGTDPYLLNFITEQARKISPAWPSK